MQTQTAETVKPEKQTLYDRIVALTPAWLEARERAERDDHMNAWFNMQEAEAIAPINSLLETIVELNLIGEDRGE